MNGQLKGLGESLLIIFVTAAINFIIGLVVWVFGMLLLRYAFGVQDNLLPGFVLALLIAAVLIALNYYSYLRVSSRIIKQEEAPRAFFEIFERNEYERLLRSLKNSPTFRITHYLIVSAIFMVAALLCIFYLRHGYLLAPVFVVFILYMWHGRGRTLRLTAAFYNGNSLIARGRAQDALHIARTMLKIRPNSVGGRWLLGNAFFAMRDYDRASQAYEEAIRHSPGSAKFLLTFLGLCFQRLGLFQRALRAYEEALRLNPGASEIHYGLACAYSLTNAPGHAMGHLERAVETHYVDQDYIERDGDLDNIRNEPRFKELMSRMS
jgi:tetratricopeptide (TPR) repeat protein